ncbi:hypothetical protein [Azospirillum largimobile]
MRLASAVSLMRDGFCKFRAGLAYVGACCVVLMKRGLISGSFCRAPGKICLVPRKCCSPATVTFRNHGSQCRSGFPA